MTLRQMLIAVLTQRGEPTTYRQLTDALWTAYPEHYKRLIELYQNDARARKEERIRLGMLVKQQPGLFTATQSEGVVLVGLAASEVDEAEEEDEEENSESANVSPSVYWYAFPAYMRKEGAYPIKVGRGNDPLARVAQQVTAMPEVPVILGTYAHDDSHTLERALHSILALRGRRKKDSPGAEWFVTTPDEIEALIAMILGK